MTHPTVQFILQILIFISPFFTLQGPHVVAFENCPKFLVEISGRDGYVVKCSFLPGAGVLSRDFTVTVSISASCLGLRFNFTCVIFILSWSYQIMLKFVIYC